MLACTACVLLLISALGSSVAPGSTEIIKYGDDPESARNHSGTHWTYGEQVAVTSGAADSVTAQLAVQHAVAHTMSMCVCSGRPVRVRV